MMSLRTLGMPAPEQRPKVLRSAGNVRSTWTLHSDAVLTDLVLTDHVNPYVDNAPIGHILAESVRKLMAQYLGRSPVTSTPRS